MEELEYHYAIPSFLSIDGMQMPTIGRSSVVTRRKTCPGLGERVSGAMKVAAIVGSPRPRRVACDGKGRRTVAGAVRRGVTNPQRTVVLRCRRSGHRRRSPARISRTSVRRCGPSALERGLGAESAAPDNRARSNHRLPRGSPRRSRLQVRIQREVNSTDVSDATARRSVCAAENVVSRSRLAATYSALPAGRALTCVPEVHRRSGGLLRRRGPRKQGL